MKRFKLLALALTAMALVAIGLTATAAPASANGGPHGGYTLTTSACGGCHRAHTATGPYLMMVESVYALCTSCHSGVVSTDVVHGELKGSTKLVGGGLKPLNGGGFEQVDGKDVTSAHTVEGLGGSTGVAKAWGSQNGVGDDGTGVEGTLECTSCHNPHGSTNYRILTDASTSSKWVSGDVDLLPWVNYQVLASREDGPHYAFDTTDIADCPANPAVAAGAPTVYAGPGVPGSKCKARYMSGVFSAATAVPDITKGMNAFCSTCHKSYLTSSGAYAYNSLNTPIATVGAGTPTPNPLRYYYPGEQDPGDDHGLSARYRHSVNRTKGSPPKQPLRFAALGNDPNPTLVDGTVLSLDYSAMGCLTCHFAHGSSAAATPAAMTGGWVATATPGPGGTPAAGGAFAADGPAGDSALLFYDNRGVCISCHQTVGNPATATPAPMTATPTRTATATRTATPTATATP